MFGMIGKISVTREGRAIVLQALQDNAARMDGCLSYIVAEDAQDETLIWVTEVWRDEAAHQASLHLPSVQAAIATARPHMTGFEKIASTHPVGGHGLVGA